MRPSFDETWLDVARVIARRGTCPRRAVGCVLVDKLNRLLSVGYNGRARGLPHCSDSPTTACIGATAASGQGLNLCEAVHAEINALMACRDPYEIATCYVTTSPCVKCTDALLNTACTRIVFAEEYAHPDARRRWLAAGPNLAWTHLQRPSPIDTLSY